MRTRNAVAAPTIVLLCAFAAFARPSLSQEPGTPTNVDATEAGAATKTVEGWVKDFEAGKRLSVTTRNGGEDTFRLDDVNVSLWFKTHPRVGEAVTVVESTDANGRETLTIAAEKPREARR